MSELLEKAILELTKLPEYQQDVIAAWILERLSQEDAEDEAAWEAGVVQNALGTALLPDGSIDFDKLDARGETVSLEELYPEGDDSGEPE
jgi:hypothetical protein